MNGIATDLPQDISRHVGARIRGRRKELGFSQEDLAGKLGITFQQVQKYEKGTNRVSAPALYRLAAILNVPLAYFFPGSGEEPAMPDPPRRAAVRASLERLRADLARIIDRHAAQIEREIGQ